MKLSWEKSADLSDKFMTSCPMFAEANGRLFCVWHNKNSGTELASCEMKSCQNCPLNKSKDHVCEFNSDMEGQCFICGHKSK